MMQAPYDTDMFLKAANSKSFVRPENERQRRLKPRASGLISCARQQAYQMAGVPETDVMQPDAVVTQEIGRLVEDYSVSVVPKIEDSPLVVAPWEGLAIVGRQVSLPDSFFVTGHPDGRVTQRKFMYGNQGRSEYANTTADGLVCGWEHKVYGAYSYKEALYGNVVSGVPGAFAQGVIYGLGLDWDAVLINIIAADAAFIRGEMKRVAQYAETGKALKTRQSNQEKLDKFKGKNAKVEVKHLDLRPYKELFRGDFEARALALSQVSVDEVDPDTVMREKQPEGEKPYPLCDYCPFKTRCIEAGTGTLRIPESPIDD